jgi:hypothetical protein
MAFAAFDAFATIKALGTRLRGDLDALAIHTACRGFGGPPDFGNLYWPISAM